MVKSKIGKHFFMLADLWLGWQDLNLRMQQSKCCVLPLDDTPIRGYYSISAGVCQAVYDSFGADSCADLSIGFVQRQHE